MEKDEPHEPIIAETFSFSIKRATADAASALSDL